MFQNFQIEIKGKTFCYNFTVPFICSCFFPIWSKSFSKHSYQKMKFMETETNNLDSDHQLVQLYLQVIPPKKIGLFWWHYDSRNRIFSTLPLRSMKSKKILTTCSNQIGARGLTFQESKDVQYRCISNFLSFFVRTRKKK